MCYNSDPKMCADSENKMIKWDKKRNNERTTTVSSFIMRTQTEITTERRKKKVENNNQSAHVYLGPLLIRSNMNKMMIKYSTPKKKKQQKKVKNIFLNFIGSAICRQHHYSFCLLILNSNRCLNVFIIRLKYE